MKVRQLGAPAQIRHVARLRLGLLLVVQEELHDVLHALRHRAAGMQHRPLAVDDGAAARRPHGHVRRHGETAPGAPGLPPDYCSNPLLSWSFDRFVQGTVL